MSQPIVREYTGDMTRGMSLMMVLTLIQVVWSSITLIWTRNEVFTDRFAPKFIFDIARALITVCFAIFWI